MCLSSPSLIQVPLSNHIPEKAGPGDQVPTEPEELGENEVIPKRISPFEEDEDVSNKVSMSSTAQSSSIFERTEVLAGEVMCSSQDAWNGEGAQWGSAAGRDASSPRGSLAPLPLRLSGCAGALKDYTSLRGPL